MAGIVKTAVSILRAPGNAIAFRLRSRLRWSKGVAALPHEDKGERLGWLTCEGHARAQDLEARFDLAALRQRSSRLVFAENLALLDSLSRLLEGTVLPVSEDGVLRAVDVGSGVFQYATALQRYLAGSGTTRLRRVVLRGIEVDGHGIYRDGHSRSDHARAHAALAGDDVHFQVGDFTAVRLPEQDLVTMWFPFVTRYSLLQWGLPLSLFAPRELFQRAAQIVRPGGLLVVASQTEIEALAVERLVQELPFTHVTSASLATDLVPYGERTLGRLGAVYRRN